MAKSIYPDIERDLTEITEESELNRFGKYGLAGYYCTNFISCVHPDDDIQKGKKPILHPCMQLVKKNCGPQDYNFVMLRWCVGIRTQENTAWYVLLHYLTVTHSEILPPGFSMEMITMQLKCPARVPSMQALCRTATMSQSAKRTLAGRLTAVTFAMGMIFAVVDPLRPMERFRYPDVY